MSMIALVVKGLHSVYINFMVQWATSRCRWRNYGLKNTWHVNHRIFLMNWYMLSISSWSLLSNPWLRPSSSWYSMLEPILLYAATTSSDCLWGTLVSLFPVMIYVGGSAEALPARTFWEILYAIGSMFVPSRSSCFNNALLHISRLSWISYLWHLFLYHVMVEHASLSSCFGPTCLLRVRVHECFHLLIFNNSVHVDHWSLFCRPERIKEICYRINRSDPCDPFRWFNATRSVSNSSPCQ